ncbi:MAG: cytochrome c [Chloroflexota bacterium]|nr:cytochrome c [Chloroflexota bacterium]
MMKEKARTGMAGILFFVIMLTGCQTSSEPPIIAVRPTDAPERAAMIAADSNLQAAERIYNLRCAHCHGYAGEGQLLSTVPNTQQLGLHTVPPHDATGHTWQHPSQLIRQVLLNGIQNPLNHYPMPPFEGVVTDEEIDQLIAYMALWWTDEQRVWQEQVTQRRTELDAEYGIPEALP